MNISEETPISKLRNILSPVYGLSEIVVLLEQNPDLKQVVIDMAKQVMINKKEIDNLLNDLKK